MDYWPHALHDTPTLSSPPLTLSPNTANTLAFFGGADASLSLGIAIAAKTPIISRAVSGLG